MISPIEPTEHYTPDFVVCDIETYASPHPKEGEVIAIDTAWRGERGIQHIGHSGWGDWWEWLSEVASDEIRFRKIYAHNGGGFDWISLTEYLLRQTKAERVGMSAACAGSKMITLSVTVRKGLSITLCDSYALLRSKLDKLAEKFIGENKVDLKGKMPHEIYLSDKNKFSMYHKQDTESLLKVMEKAIGVLRDGIAKVDGFGMTIGSTALKVFRTGGLSKPIAVPQDDKLKDFLRRGYNGGRVECFQPGIYDTIRVYDINSLYPSVMASTSVPISDRGVFTTLFIPERVGIFDVEFEQKNRSIPSVLLQSGFGVYRGRGVYFSPELNLLRRVDPKCIIKVIQGYQFFDCEPIFRDFILRCYALRLKDKSGPLGELCKYIMNSLYGKFGQHSERESIVLDEETDLKSMLEDGENIRCVNPQKGVFGVTRDVRCEFEHVGIAGLITSEARVKLYEGMVNVPRSSLVYVDTDSLHITGSLPASDISDEIGKWKLETEGEGVYAGKKLYAIRGGTGVVKIRAKGVSVGGRNGTPLSFDDFKKLVNWEKVRCDFSKFPTAMDIFKGKRKSGRMFATHKNIRRIR